MENEMRLTDVSLFEKALEQHRGLVMHNEDILGALANCPTVDAVEVSRLGGLGRLMMPYKGCPRGRIGAKGQIGNDKASKELALTTLDVIEDVDGNRWMPILEDDLERLKARAQNTAEVVHGRWEPNPRYPGYDRCSACCNCNIGDDWGDGEKWNYCPHCGAKMDGGKDND